MKKNEKNPVYANHYRQFRNDITTQLDEDYEQHIKKQSWSTIHKITMDTLQEYWHHGLKPGQEIPANSSRNTIYSFDGVRSPRPTLSETEKITETILDVKDKAVEAGRVAIEVVYGKEIHVNPLDGMEGVSRGFKKRFDRFPGNYGNYQEPLPLPDWVFEEEHIPPVTIPTIPEDLAQALDRLKIPVLQLLKDKEAFDKAWPKVYPVLSKYNLI